MQLSAYIRLMRLEKPIGILLLWFPTAWALWLATNGHPSYRVFFIFLLGTIVMRSAGCVMNDIADRRLDGWVARTRLRPLVTGEVSLPHAFYLLFSLLVVAFILVLFLPIHCFYYALIALIFAEIYPFCKRFLHAPQCVLGLAFSMGIPMAYAAFEVPLNGDVLFLLCINILWVIAYDTIYAMADKEDDLKIGIRSTAIFFGRLDRAVIAGLQMLVQILWLVWTIKMQVSLCFYVFWVAATCNFLWQQWLIVDKKPTNCMRAFKSNAYYGAMMWLALIFNTIHPY